MCGLWCEGSPLGVCEPWNFYMHKVFRDPSEPWRAPLPSPERQSGQMAHSQREEHGEVGEQGGAAKVRSESPQGCVHPGRERLRPDTGEVDPGQIRGEKVRLLVWRQEQEEEEEEGEEGQAGEAAAGVRQRLRRLGRRGPTQEGQEGEEKEKQKGQEEGIFFEG